MTKLLLITLAGGLGALLRYLIAGWGQARFAPDAGFPAGTLFVNVLGCLVIGVLAATFEGPWLVPPNVRAALAIGLVGGFTTFSTFGLETFELINQGQFPRALANIGLSVALGLLAVFVGYRVTTRLLGA